MEINVYESDCGLILDTEPQNKGCSKQNVVFDHELQRVWGAVPELKTDI